MRMKPLELVAQHKEVLAQRAKEKGVTAPAGQPVRTDDGPRLHQLMRHIWMDRSHRGRCARIDLPAL
jgi:hypothetical protein